MRPRDKEKLKASVMFPLSMCTYANTQTYIYTHKCDIYKDFQATQLPGALTKRN